MNINTDYENEFGVVYTDIGEYDYRTETDREAERREWFGYIDENGELQEEYLDKKYVYKDRYQVGMLFPIHPEEDVCFVKDDIRNRPYLIRKMYVDEVENASTMVSGEDEFGIYMTEILPDEIEKIAKAWILKQFVSPVFNALAEENEIDVEKTDCIDMLNRMLEKAETDRDETVRKIYEGVILNLV